MDGAGGTPVVTWVCLTCRTPREHSFVKAKFTSIYFGCVRA